MLSPGSGEPNERAPPEVASRCKPHGLAPALAALPPWIASLVGVLQALQKFNEALAHNKQLRETIDNLRRERVVFDQIYKKLVRARSQP